MSAEVCDGIAHINWERGGPCARFVPSCPLHKCAICEHHTEVTFTADSNTHKIANRSGNPIAVGLCVHCWGKFRKNDEAA